MDAQRELTDLSNESWQRLWKRLEGLSDAEYLWEPAPDCWTIRENSNGSWVADGLAAPREHEQFTTIAWRLWHLIDMYGEDRAPIWLGVEAQGDPIGLDDPAGEPPASASAALAMLDRAHRRWDAHLALAGNDLLGDSLGAVAGPYAGSTKAAYVLHMLDEFIHHGAELALLRDLWRAQHGSDQAAT